MTATVSATTQKRSKVIAPLTAPFLPPVPEDFVSWAEKQEVSVEYVVRQCLYGGGGYQMEFSANKAGDKKITEVLPGHRWYADPDQASKGPEPCEVMVIGKAVNFADVETKRVYAGDMGHVLLNALQGAGWKGQDITQFYITTVLKTVPHDYTKTTLPADWVSAQRILLMQELMLVRPKYVLLQGAEAIKAVLGSRAKMSSMEGQVLKQVYDFRTSPDDPEDLHEIQFFVSVSPGAVLHDRKRPGSDSKYRTHVEQRLHQNLKFFRQTVKGIEHAAEDYRYEVVRDTATLEFWLQKMREECQDNLVAWDAEWQGQHPQNADHYIRCIQFAYKPNHAVVIALTEPGGRPSFKRPVGDGERWTTEGAAAEVARLCKQYMKGLRVAGHYFNADLEMLVPFGLDLRAEYDACVDWRRADKEGGVAIELAAHAWDETALFSLDEQVMAHLDIPKYSADLATYKKTSNEAVIARYNFLRQPVMEAKRDYGRLRKRVLQLADGRQRKRKVSPAVLAEARQAALESGRRLAQAKRTQEYLEADLAAKKEELDNGYGWMSDKTLYFYAAWDATAELLLARKYMERIRGDRFGNDCRRAYWISHRAAIAALEINTEGILVDRARLDRLAQDFAKKRDELLARLRRRLRWPEFNPRSKFEFAEALFGEEHNGYLQQYGKRKRTRPPGAITLRAEPLRATGKQSVEWAVVRSNEEQRQYAAKTCKQTLGEMYYLADKLRVRRFDVQTGRWYLTTEDHSEIIGLMRDYRYMDQALKSLMREPTKDILGEYASGEDDFFEYDEGVSTVICDDGRVRTHIRQTVETGRWASLRPSMQNAAKSREYDFKRILGDVESVSIRSIFKALDAYMPASNGEDWFLVECDYSGAELMTAAIMSQDATMIDHCQRNNLPEDHPDYYDIHSALTVEAFRLDCAPTKDGLKSIGKDHLRTVAKSIAFGSLYGRGAKAIAIAVRQEGVFITVEEAQQMQDAFFNTYPSLRQFFEECKARVAKGWMCDMFGRFRRFPHTEDQKKYASYEREAMNATIQGGVADAMSLACRNLIDYRNAADMRFKLCLQIHDAVLLHVPASELEHVIDRDDGVLQTCMVKAIPLYPTDLSGKRLPIEEPYRYGSSIDIYDRWGEHPDAGRFLRNNLDPTLDGWWEESTGVWRHKAFKHAWSERLNAFMGA